MKTAADNLRRALAVSDRFLSEPWFRLKCELHEWHDNAAPEERKYAEQAATGLGHTGTGWFDRCCLKKELWERAIELAED